MRISTALVLALMLAAFLPVSAAAKIPQLGRTIVVFGPDVWDRQAEALAGVEKAFLETRQGTLIAFPARPGSLSELGERLEMLDSVVEIYSARVISTTTSYGEGTAYLRARVFLGLRVYRVLSGTTLEIVGFSEAQGEAGIAAFSLLGQPSVDYQAAVIAAYRAAASKIFNATSP